MCHLYAIDQRFFGGPAMPSLANLGMAGVDLFFVLSGFVMVLLARVGAGHPAVVPAFLLARAARIYPLWWLALGAISLVWLVQPTWVFSSIAAPPNLLADFILWPHARQPLLAVGWTLIHEMYYYLAFGLLLLFPMGHLVRGLMVWMFLVALGNVWISSLGVTMSPVLTLVTHPLTLEFGLGATVGLLAARGVRPAPFILLWLGLIWMLAASLLTHDPAVTLFENDWLRVAAFGPAWALIVLGMVGLETDRGIVLGSPLIELGDASYALYLVHVPVLVALARLIAPFCGPNVWDNILAWALSLTATVTTALLVRRYVECPILARLTRLRRKLLPRGSAMMESPSSPRS